MAINFPTSLDTFTNPTSADTLASPAHATQHADINDAVEAIEAQIGTTASPVLARLASPTFTGNVGIGGASAAGRTLTLSEDITGSTVSQGIRQAGEIQSDVTSSVQVYRSSPSTQAASFTLATLAHYYVAGVATPGAGSTITNQYGFWVDASATGATNNYGFRGAIASSANRYNIYMDGTAANYMAGRLGVGATLTSGAMAQIVNTAAADKAFVVKGAASQSGSLFDIQNSSGTSLFTVSDIGNLNVASNVTTGDSTVQIGTGRTGNGYAYIDLVGDTTYTDFGLRLIRNNNGANATSEIQHRGTGNFVLVTQEAAPILFSTTNTERMRIDSSGFVGVGTSAPTVRLEVSGSTTISSQTNVAATFGSSASGRLLVGSVTGNTPFIGSEGATNLLFYTNAVERMRIDSSGRVGIGVTPTSKLHVVGSFSRGAPVTKTASFTLADTENWVICNGTASITVTLPAASTQVGREISLKNIAAFTVVSASSNVVPLTGGAAGTAILATAGTWATLVSDGTNWIIMQS